MATILKKDPAKGNGPKSIVAYVETTARVVLGITFTVMGLNGFVSFLPSSPVPAAATAFFGALFQTGYMIQLIMGTQLVAGILLLSNRFVPLALALLAPVVVNIIAFHAFLVPSGLPSALVMLTLEFYLAWTYRNAYRPMLAMRSHRARPSGRTSSEEA